MKAKFALFLVWSLFFATWSFAAAAAAAEEGQQADSAQSGSGSESDCSGN